MCVSSLGKEQDVITISPRTLFVSKNGCTFLAAGKRESKLLYSDILIFTVQSCLFPSPLDDIFCKAVKSVSNN